MPPDEISGKFLDTKSFCVAGTYSHSFKLFSLVEGQYFKEIYNQELGTQHGSEEQIYIPHSIKLVDMQVLNLLVGMRDGTVLRYDFTFHSGKVDLQLNSGVRRIGTLPVSLLSWQSENSVLAISDHLWLIQLAKGENNRANFNSLSFNKTTHAAPLRIGSHDGLLFLSENCLHIVAPEQTKKLAVQKISLSGIPTRLLYHKESKLLVVSVTNASRSKSQILLIDPMSQKIQHSWNLLPNEIVYSITRWNQSTGNHSIVVTTSMNLNSEVAVERKGRILLFQIIQSKDSQDVDMESQKENNFMLFLQLQETDIEPALCSCTFQGNLLVACITNLYMFKLIDLDNSWTLQLISEFNTKFPILSMSATISRVALATQKEGVLLLAYRDEKKEFEWIDSDSTLRMTSDVLMIDDENMVGVDKMGTFFPASISRQSWSTFIEKSQGNCIFRTSGNISENSKGKFGDETGK